MCDVVDQFFDPPRLTTPAQTAEEFINLDNPGSYQGPWLNSMNPPMVEPMEMLASPVHSGLAFVGPAQCGKTQSLILNGVAHSALVDPADTIIYNPTHAAARDFSVRRIDRMHQHSPKVGEMLVRAKDTDNKFDKTYRNGMLLTLSWPSSSEFAGKPIPRVYITDYDRMDDDIEGEGNAFDLGSKRTTSFRSFGMCVVESSPSRPVEDPKWIKKTAHEAPPCKGIIALYNRGDRRRWYWPCPACGTYFEGTFRHLTYNTKLPTLVEIGESVRLACPAKDCDYLIHPNERYEMQQRGRWLADGQTITKDGIIHGTGPRTDIVSYWLNGIAAMFTTWGQLVKNYIIATQDFERTGDETALTKFYNTDLGEPYVPKAIAEMRLPETLEARKEPIGGTQENPTVPPWVRTLVATVDVQQNMFIVQVIGLSPGEPYDMTVVDRFRIHLSDGRKDSDGQIAWVKPGVYLEDWDLLISRVMDRTYPLEAYPDRRMSIKVTACDSGGKAGVTANAYKFYRKLRSEGRAGRFWLVKGDGSPIAPRAKINYPDSGDRSNKAAAQGDVPVVMLASNTLKDQLSNRLDSLIEGKGLIRFPEWLPQWFYAELTSETRDDKGWHKTHGARNEAWDLFYYAIGIIHFALKMEAVDFWKKAPAWAAPQEKNSLVSSDAAEAPFAHRKERRYDFAKLGSELAA